MSADRAVWKGPALACCIALAIDLGVFFVIRIF
jgi:hypothetical protein